MNVFDSFKFTLTSLGAPAAVGCQPSRCSRAGGPSYLSLSSPVTQLTCHSAHLRDIRSPCCNLLWDEIESSLSTGTAHSLLHVLLVRLQDVPYAVHQLLDLGSQALGGRLLQDTSDQLLRVPVALIVHHGGGSGSAGRPAATSVVIVVASSQRDLALGAGRQCGMGGLGGGICGLRGWSGGGVAAV
ncbi:hypothetical protein EYF80_035122 [Liparis tanakae]|uniref:Uncharacterized protein n=1 Tax=Liparis tanakae TaxID=230148 RepID=A0A4Z2GN24_9TELE|nr:hypothetical protein EYF80_035122 [Liparis tanakae]